MKNLLKKICIYLKDDENNKRVYDIVKNNFSNFSNDYYKTMGLSITACKSKNNPNISYSISFINPSISKNLRNDYFKGSSLIITDDESLAKEMPEELARNIFEFNKNDSSLEEKLLLW
jgi:hypothetical protein